MYESFASKQWVTTASIPVTTAEGRLLGVAAADVVLQELSSFMSKLRVSATGVAFIVDGTGTLVALSSGHGDANVSPGVSPAANSSEPIKAINSSLPLVAATALWWSKQSPAATSVDNLRLSSLVIEGREVDVAGRRIIDIPGVDWHVLVATPRRDFVEPIIRSALYLFVVTCVALAAALSLGLWVLRRVTRDVQHLVELTGHADVKSESLPRKKLVLKELATLEAAFHDMFQRWREAWNDSQAQRLQLRALNETLETRVDERTQALRSATEELQAEVVRRSLYEQELVKRTDQAQQAAAAKALFAAYLSHELRTPLQSILGSAHALRQDTSASVASTQQRIDVIEAACRALISIIDGVLLYARYEAGGIQPVLKAFDLPGLLQDCRRIAESAYPNPQVPILTEFAADVPRSLVSDAGFLRQIVVNLLSNAFKFTRSGHIKMSVSWARLPEDSGRGQLCLTVEDTGSGMPEAVRERLFQLYQSDSMDRSGIPGTGVGLSLSYHLARALGGELAFASELGRGTRASLTLPVTIEEPMRAASPVSVADSQELLPKLDILIVEDHPLNRTILVGMLQEAGHQVESAETGAEALRMAEQRNFSFVLMDLNLPDLCGFEVCRRMLAGAAARGQTPPRILALSASTLDADRAEAERAGMKGFITKPASIESILAALRSCLSSTPVQAQGPQEELLPVLDLGVIEALRNTSVSGGTISMLERVVQLALVELPKDVENWRLAVERGDAVLAHSAAHRIAGAAAVAGGRRLAQASRDYMAGRIDAQHAQLQEHLEEFLHALRGLDVSG